MYCGYVNGVYNYAARIAGDTEKYWCGVQHQKDPLFGMPKHQSDFIEYGDEEQFLELKSQN